MWPHSRKISVFGLLSERKFFDSFCKVVLRHEMLTCFREFSYQNKWLVSLHYLPPSALDGICTTDQYPSDYIAFSVDGYTLQISNEQLANIIEELPQPERRLLILRFVLELNDRKSAGGCAVPEAPFSAAVQVFCGICGNN